ncbi:Unknown protein [Striga hermonthica]|uniref:GRF zinc finger containing protein n=1 Tax=Striga hermonthica TaxID=68872 RepID=A0A9N7NI60_STRHE|nr:Unknown protein [Striga hermonthica]
MGLPQSGLGWLVGHGDEVGFGLEWWRGCCIDVGVEVVVVVGRLGLRRSPCCLSGAVVWLLEMGSVCRWVFSRFFLFRVDWGSGFPGLASGVRRTWFVPAGAACSPVLLVDGGLTLVMVRGMMFSFCIGSCCSFGAVPCVRGRVRGGCKFFEWEDPPICRREKAIIPGLLRRVNALEDENKALRQKNMRLLKFAATMVVFILVFVIKL